MIRTFDLIIPTMPDSIYYRTGTIGKKQDGFKPLPSISITQLSEEEAIQFGEEMKQAFINHWREKTNNNASNS